MFCTEEQVSFCQFHQFCILTKESIENSPGFVYNVRIAVQGTKKQAEVGECPCPKGEMKNHVHSKFYP